MDSVSQKHQSFLDAVASRKKKIDTILHMYFLKGNITSTIYALDKMEDVGVTNDVMQSAFLEGKAVRMLTLENAIFLLGHCESMLSRKVETFMTTGLRVGHALLKHFEEDLAAMKVTPIARGVDLSREERLRRCD